MSPRRVLVLLGKELARGPRNFLIIFAIIVPVVVTLVLSLLFGSFFSGKPRLGLADDGRSRFLPLAQALDAVIVQEYPSAGALRDAVAAGAVDVGVALPPEFDTAVADDQPTEITAYIWGQSLLRNRAALATTIAVVIRDLAGQEAPVEIVTTTLGETEVASWNERLLPLIVLMTIVIGGSMVPAASLVDEKQKRTLTALTITPTSVNDVYLAKGLLGALLSVVMGVVILALNQAFGTRPSLLIFLLVLSAILAAEFGVLLGAFIKDINTLFATVKAIGLLLYAPAIVYLFPQIPAWIGRIFPTYYIVGPIVEVSQAGAGWADVAGDVAVLIGLIAVLAAVIGLVGRQTRLKPA